MLKLLNRILLLLLLLAQSHAFAANDTSPNTPAPTNASAIAQASSVAANTPKITLQCGKLLKANADETLLTPPASRLEFIQSLSLAVDLDQFAAAEFGKYRGKRVLKALRKLNTQFDALVVDPGVMSHYKAFLAFAKDLRARGELPSNPWVAREKFSQHLGTKTYYRAIAVDQADAATIQQQNGLDSSLLWRSQGLNSPELENAWQQELSQGLQHGVRARFGQVLQNIERLRFNPFLSISDFPDIAVGISNTAYGDASKDKVMLFEIEIPKLDVIELSNNAFFRFPKFVEILGFLTRLKSTARFPDGSVNGYPYNYRVESMVVYRFEATEIKRVYLLDKKTQPTWKGQVFGKAQVTISAEEYLNGIEASLIRRAM